MAEPVDLQHVDADAPLRLEQSREGGISMRRHELCPACAGKPPAGGWQLRRSQENNLRHCAQSRRWRSRCRVQPKEPNCGSSPPRSAGTEKSSAMRVGSSATARERSARAALERTARGLNKTLPSTSAAKYQPARDGGRHPAQVLIVDVLNIYLADKAGKHARPDETKQRLLTLADFWQPFMLADVNGAAVPRVCHMARRPAMEVLQPGTYRPPATARRGRGRAPRVGGPSGSDQPSSSGRALLRDRLRRAP